MSRQIMPHYEEIDHTTDYARWQFETMRAEWEAEQEQEEAEGRDE